MNKIAVIMPSFLGEYEGAAKNRNQKFLRAVRSFLNQTHKKKHLVIISDGCDKTIKLYSTLFAQYKNITCIELPKQPLFSGVVRQVGINFATRKIKADIIVPLDSDDLFLYDNHLSVIDAEMKDNDFIYADEYYFLKHHENGSDELGLHKVELLKDVAGTSSVVWRNKPEFSWKGLDGWGHDYRFWHNVLIPHSKKYSKVEGLSYCICHVKGMFDN
jgi:glycosyltransferase involved in cell wall biosynthesis